MRRKFNSWVCLIISLMMTAPAGAANESRAFKSFLEHRPRASEFPEQMRPLASAVEEGFAEAAAGHADAARAHFNRALEAQRQLHGKVNRGYEDQLFYLGGMAEEGLGRNKEALQAYEQSLKLRPNNLLSVFRSGYVLKQLGRCNEAIPKFKELDWQVKELSFEMKYLIGDCQASMNETEQALKSFQASYEKNPGYLPVLRKMVGTRKDLLEKTQNPQQRALIQTQLVNDLSSVVRQQPDDRDASLELARLLLQMGDSLADTSKVSRAEQLARRFVDSSKFTDDTAARVMIQAQIKRGALDQAQRTLSAALKITPKSKELAEAKRQIEIEQQVKALPPEENS